MTRHEYRGTVDEVVGRLTRYRHVILPGGWPVGVEVTVVWEEPDPHPAARVIQSYLTNNQVGEHGVADNEGVLIANALSEAGLLVDVPVDAPASPYCDAETARGGYCGLPRGHDGDHDWTYEDGPPDALVDAGPLKDLYLGPDGTYFCRRDAVPDGWAWRSDDGAEWKRSGRPHVSIADLWVQCRPPQDDDR